MKTQLNIWLGGLGLFALQGCKAPQAEQSVDVYKRQSIFLVASGSACTITRYILPKLLKLETLQSIKVRNGNEMAPITQFISCLLYTSTEVGRICG